MVSLIPDRQLPSPGTFNGTHSWDGTICWAKSNPCFLIQSKLEITDLQVYTRKDSLKENSPTSLCIWWQKLIKESQPISDAFFPCLQEFWLKSHSWLGAAILDLPLFARRPRRTFPTSLTVDVTSEIAEDDWERGWEHSFSGRPNGKFPGATTEHLKRQSSSFSAGGNAPNGNSC